MDKHAKMRPPKGGADAAPPCGDGIPALWHVGPEEMLFAGPLGYNARHSHAAPLFLAGLYEEFSIRLSVQRGWQRCAVAVIPPGVAYELDVAGNPLAVFYLEPRTAGIEALRPLVWSGEWVDGALLGAAGEAEPLRRLYEDPLALDHAGLVLQDLMAFSNRRAGRRLDPRINKAVAVISSKQDELGGVGDVAGRVGLSSSHFQHLFSQSVGVPFRRYRAWHRLRSAIHNIIAGESFTAAAHGAGYFDQAHFCRHFRQSFGAAPSMSLKQVRRPQGAGGG